MSANLLSLGVVDFGIIIGGAVVMVKGLFVMLDHETLKYDEEKFNRLGKAIFLFETDHHHFPDPDLLLPESKGEIFSPLTFTLGFILIFASAPYPHASSGAFPHPAEQKRQGKKQPVHEFLEPYIDVGLQRYF